MDGFDKVIGNLGADGLVHDVFLLTLGYHYNRNVRVNLLDVLQCLQSAHTYHVFVKKHQIILVGAAHVKRIVAVGHGVNFIALVLKKQYVCPEKVYLIIDPKQCSYFIVRHRFLLLEFPQTGWLRQFQTQVC